MDDTTKQLLAQWQASLTDKEKRLYELARVKLKKNLNNENTTCDDGDNGSFFPEYCHGFQTWKKKTSQT
jgi:hypothetical protein